MLGVGDDLVALLAGEATGGDEVLVGVDEKAQQRRSPRQRVGVEDVELLGRGEVVGLELHVEIEGRVVDAPRLLLGGGRAVDRGHRQKAILESPCGALEVPVSRRPKALCHLGAVLLDCTAAPGHSSVARLRGPFATGTSPPAAAGGGRGGRRSRG